MRAPRSSMSRSCSSLLVCARARRRGRCAGPGAGRELRSGHRCDVAEPRSGGLADVAQDARRMGLQPPGRDHAGQRRRPAHGLVAGVAARHAGGDAARLRRRAVHAEPARRHPGHRRGHRRPPLGAPPRDPRRRRGLPLRLRDQPQHRHPRQPDHRHQRRRPCLRARRDDRRAGLGDADPRLPDAPGQPDLGPDHRQRQGGLGPQLHAAGRAGRLRHHGPRRDDGRGAVAQADDPGPRRAGRRDVGRRAVRAARPRRGVDGAQLRSGAGPGLHRDVGHLARAEVPARRNRQHAPVPQFDARARRGHGRDPLALPASERPLGPRSPVRAPVDRHRVGAGSDGGPLDQSQRAGGGKCGRW